MGRKLLVLMLSLLFAIGMVGCGNKKAPAADSETESTADESQTQDTQTEDTAETTDETAEDAASESNTEETTDTAAATGIDNVVIFDQDGFKVTAVSLGVDDYGDQALNVFIENNSEKDATFQVADVSVNGYMDMPLFSSDVTAGNTANDVISFYMDTLEEGGITGVSTIEFKLLVLDPTSFETIVESDVITLDSGLADFGTYDNSGETVYDENGIKVVAQYLDTDEIFGQEIIFYIENNTDKAIAVQNNDVALNGTMAEATLYSEVGAGKKAVSEMTFYGLEDAGITDIIDAEFSLNIFDPESWDTIADTETIALTFE